jgi:hypothetical protein
LKNERLVNPPCYNAGEVVPALREKSFFFGVTVVFLAFVTIPYLIAHSAAGPASVFGGFLFNPLDGNSYLAKMHIVQQGGWLFYLPYTAEKGSGAVLFGFYILLGHLARWLGLSLIFTFHVARLIASVILLLSLSRFFGYYLSDSRSVRFALIMAAFGAGMGWFMLPFGVFTSDFLVAEAYPFLSCFANPHFPLSLALLLYLFTPEGITLENRSRRALGILLGFLASAALALISPFSVVIALVVWTGTALWQGIQKFGQGWRDWILQPIQQVLLIALGGVPILVYQVFAIRMDPQLSGWNSQNITPAPPLWDVFVALSPLILIIPFGLRLLIKNNTSTPLLVVWLISGILLLYLPWGLQRRFLVGIFVPVVALASLTLNRMVTESRRFWLRGITLLVLAVPTNVLIVQAGFHGIRVRDDQLFLTRDEADALAWIETSTPEDSLILSSPDIGLFIPAHTGRRVIYGHPFETVHAVDQKLRVEQFFQGDTLPTLVQKVDYIFYGPRERALGGNPVLDGLVVTYRNNAVTIFRTH